MSISFKYHSIFLDIPQCPFTSRETYKETNETVIYLDGSVISYLQAIIPIINDNSDITVAIAVCPDHPVEGVIWDIQIPGSRDTDQSWRLRLSLTDKNAVFEIRNATGNIATMKLHDQSHLRQSVSNKHNFE